MLSCYVNWVYNIISTSLSENIVRKQAQTSVTISHYIVHNEQVASPVSGSCQIKVTREFKKLLGMRIMQLF